MSTKVVTLMEDSASEHLSMTIEHGLSFYIETPQTRFLFDCGATRHLLDNAKKMGIALTSLDCVVCSHAHYDHAGGFPAVHEQTGVSRLVTGEAFFSPKYAHDGAKYTYLGSGFQLSYLEQNHIQHDVCTDMLRLDDTCCVMGNFTRNYDFETIPSRFVQGNPLPCVSKDTFQDEICLTVEVGTGLAVIVGCSHPGILNILDTVHKRTGRPIVSVWGGIHLMEADEARVFRTISELKSMGVQTIGVSHCSGTLIRELARKDGTLSVCHLSTGDQVML